MSRYRYVIETVQEGYSYNEKFIRALWGGAIYVDLE